MASRGRSLIALVTLVVAVGALVVLSSGSDPAPFDPESSEPDGYRAISLMLSDNGVTVERSSPGEIDPSAYIAGDVVVVPIAERATPDELDVYRDIASSGATVVLAAEDYFAPIERQELVRAEASPVAVGLCEIAELDSLEAVDNISYEYRSQVGEFDEVCFSESFGALVAREPLGAGSIVHLASPYLWANARLQPDKEDGGEPLDNGAMALALLGGGAEGAGATVTFVDASGAATATADGTRSPIELMPFTVKVALVQAGFAFVFYAWWRARRLGAPVGEPMPVKIAGSELVAAVGGLLRRHGSIGRASAVLRDRKCQELAAALGVPREAGPDALTSAVAARSGRDPEEVREILFGAVPPDAAALVTLTHRLDTLHTEVLDVEPAR